MMDRPFTDAEAIKTWLVGNRDLYDLPDIEKRLAGFLEYRDRAHKQSDSSLAEFSMILPAVEQQSDERWFRHQTCFFVDRREFIVRGWNFRYDAATDSNPILELSIHHYQILTADAPDAQELLRSRSK